MLVQRRRRWANIKTALVRRLVFGTELMAHGNLLNLLLIYWVAI